MLWDPQSTHGQLAVPDLRPGGPAQVPALPQARRSLEAHQERDEVGARQLRPVDSRGGQVSAVSNSELRLGQDSGSIQRGA